MDNSEIFIKILTTLFIKISRRTTKKNATVILNRVLKELKNKYSYLILIKINDISYKENEEFIQIDNIQLLNRSSSENLDNCIKDIFELTINYLQRDADYFFIREFKDAVYKIDDFEMDDKEFDLNKLQFKYIINRKQDLKIKNSKILNVVIEAFLNTLNKLSKNIDSYTLIKSILKSSYNQFDFLKAIKIEKEENIKNQYIISIDLSIDYIPTYNISKAIIYLIEQIGFKINSQNKSLYINTLKSEIDSESLLSLKKIGVNLNLIDLTIFKVEFNNILNKVLSTLFLLLSEEKPKDIILKKMKEIISELIKNYKFLENVTIKENSSENDYDIFEIKTSINNIPAYRFAKALREIIIYTLNYFSNDKTIFIEKFKQNIGEEYLYEIEKIGVNLHFLEMKFLISK